MAIKNILLRQTDKPEQIEKTGRFVVDHECARINQAPVMILATVMGFKKIAVTEVTDEVATLIQRIHPGQFIVAVHINGISHNNTEQLVAVPDWITSCASKPIWERAGKKALSQAGIPIPVFAITSRAKELVLEKIRQSSEEVLIKPT